MQVEGYTQTSAEAAVTSVLPVTLCPSDEFVYKLNTDKAYKSAHAYEFVQLHAVAVVARNLKQVVPVEVAR